MANIFGALTLVVLLLTAYLAFKNKGQYETEINARQQEEQRLETSQARLKAAQEKLNGINTEIPEVDAQTAQFVDAENAQKKKNDDFQAAIQTKTAAIEAGKARLDQVREKASAFGNINELAQKMRDLGSELQELSQSIDSNQAKLSNLISQNNSLEAVNNTEKSILDGYSRGESKPGLVTRIRSIYPTWGFVTLASGGAAGVAANSTLDVVRNGQVIAKLLVTAVETGSASASIIPDSVSEDVTLMVGDQVVPGSKAAAAAN